VLPRFSFPRWKYLFPLKGTAKTITVKVKRRRREEEKRLRGEKVKRIKG